MIALEFGKSRGIRPCPSWRSTSAPVPRDTCPYSAVRWAAAAPRSKLLSRWLLSADPLALLPNDKLLTRLAFFSSQSESAIDQQERGEGSGSTQCN